MSMGGAPIRVDRRPGADRWVDLGFALVMATVISIYDSRWAAPPTPLLLIAAAAWLPLLLRSRWPLAVLVAVVAVEATHIAFFDQLHLATNANTIAVYQPVPLASMLAAYTVAARRRPATGWLAGIAAATILALTGLTAHGMVYAATDAVTANLVMIATALGVVAAMRRDKRLADVKQQQHLRAEAVRDERLRIARDLHDVLAHDLTLINAQAGVAEYLLRRDPDAAATALRDITAHTTQAVDDLRATLRLLREHDDDSQNRAPTPSFTDLDELISAATTRGTTVRSTITGNPHPLPPAVDLAAYRIAQEALTNAAKHAPGSPAEVSISWADEHLVIDVTNPIIHAADDDGRSGHGLIGMRERVASVGGTITTGPDRYGRYVVHAILPTSGQPEAP